MNVDERWIERLMAIRKLALEGYPFRDDETADPTLALAAGMIAGIVDRALADYRRAGTDDC